MKKNLIFHLPHLSPFLPPLLSPLVSLPQISTYFILPSSFSSVSPSSSLSSSSSSFSSLLPSSASLLLSNFFGRKILEGNIVLPYLHIINIAKKEDDVVLLGGREEFLHEWAKEIGVKTYVTLNEYCALFPALVPISRRPPPSASFQSEILSRLTSKREEEKGGRRTEEGVKPIEIEVNGRREQAGVTIDFSYPFPVKKIFMLGVPNKWEEYCQVLVDLLAAGDGVIGKKKEEGGWRVEVYWAEGGKREGDKLGLASLREGVRVCYKLIYEEEVKWNEEGESIEKENLKSLGLNNNQDSYFFEFEESEYGKAAKELGWKTDMITEKQITDKNITEAVKKITNLIGLD